MTTWNIIFSHFKILFAVVDATAKTVTHEIGDKFDIKISIEDEDFLLIGKKEKRLKDLFAEVCYNLSYLKFSNILLSF